jgi:hypothetical protein
VTNVLSAMSMVDARLEKRIADRLAVTLDRNAHIELTMHGLSRGERAQCEGLGIDEARALADTLRAFADAAEWMLAPAARAAE